MQNSNLPRSLQNMPHNLIKPRLRVKDGVWDCESRVGGRHVLGFGLTFRQAYDEWRYRFRAGRWS